MPIGRVILFDDDHHMYVLPDQGSAEAWWEMPDEYVCGFDSLARPLRMTGEPHQVTLELTGAEPAEADLRRLVTDHYQRFLYGQAPPEASDLAAFVAGLPGEGSNSPRR
ncbi:hypothetical protein ACIPPM_29640 [Streptomyces sp. NPDC090119]|uniref:hypothetical protein n=1 Tax=Streptomyces sp. NPDC090119 TaxID=3365951 RepID=UPI00382874D2